MSCKHGCDCQDGDKGPMGPQGDKGDTGVAGAVGVDGAPGIQGPTGPQGVQGDIGPQGPAGVNGTFGSIGPAGPTGPQGTTGIQGIQGVAGNDGADGTNGSNGQGRITYVVNTDAAPATHNAILNEGIILKNTAFVDIQLDPAPTQGDVVQVVGTSFGTGGWKIIADPAHTIQLTNQAVGNLITSPGGEIIIAATNYRDVITMMFDGTSTWLIINKIFANNSIPLFT